MAIYLPPCNDEKIDCFGCINTHDKYYPHRCLILTTGIKNCPFYKTKEQYEKERKFYETRK